ncbi:MarR family transcriptional regulator [uncultured Sphingopyxis sp.]|jgi:DNA-binding MarR family transcriptional regulator|uniref:MarR family transcriptional regulator n=1 Tax=uncultured Sphingopyxis sp. TaxID=310581 RepID=UPI000AD950C3|nr:MarR family transcriptional regulator [uncultured Sphingopyxis sp.]
MEQMIDMRPAKPVFPLGLNETRTAWSAPRDEGAPARLLFVGCDAACPDVDRVAGVRLVAVVPSMRAAGHLRAMIAADILWIAGAEAIESETFADLMAAAAERQCGLVCETTLAALDRVAAAVPDALRTQWLVDADPAERLVALAAARPSARLAVHDISRDEAMERIDRLQDEVARISRLLGELAGQPGLAGAPRPGGGIVGYDAGVRAPTRDFSVMPRSFEPEERTRDRQRAKAVRHMLRQRRMREQYFAAGLFADPAWDMLLDLYAARLERQPVSVSSLCIAAAVPATTALRWIKTMTDAGIFLREADPQDGRRIFIALSDGANEAMARYFEALDE